MTDLDFNTPMHVYFIGIGGISMSGLAELLKAKGFTVTGSDLKRTKVTSHLESLGIDITYGQRAENITPNIDLAVYTSAVKETHSEYMAAQALNIPLMDRGSLVGQIMKQYKFSYAVSGTHGKTTSTSMLATILIAAGFDPTVSVGGILNSIGGNIRIGSSDCFVAEACEYTNSFLKFFPTHAGILNIEAEHLDFFKDLDDIRASFKQFAQLLPADGLLAINGHIDNYEYITKELACPVVTFGIPAEHEHFDYTADNISFDSMGCGEYDLFEYGKMLCHIHLGVPGEHNILDSLCAAALARSIKASPEALCEALKSFHGTQRRFELKGEIGGVTVIDDYAHHPSEIHATLTAAQNYPHKTLWCVFQPHTYSRTKQFLHDFAKELALADKIVLADIYSAARETDTGEISSRDIEKILRDEYGKEVYYFPSFDEIENFLLQNCISGDLLITMGAGDVVIIGESLLGR